MTDSRQTFLHTEEFGPFSTAQAEWMRDRFARMELLGIKRPPYISTERSRRGMATRTHKPTES